MTLKQIFKKVENYNELATMMGNKTARIYFHEVFIRDPEERAKIDKKRRYLFEFGETFESYKVLEKFIRCEYDAELAEEFIKSKDWEIGKINKFHKTVEMMAELEEA